MVERYDEKEWAADSDKLYALSLDDVDPEWLAKKLEDWRWNFPRYARENLRIQHKHGRLIPFILNRAQRLVWKKILKRLKAGLPVRLYILKARQLGMSTLIQGLIYWYVTLHDNRNALVVSHALDSAEALFTKSKVFYNQSPKILQPHLKLSNRRELYFARDPDPTNPDDKDTGLQSRILVQVAQNEHLGASLTLHFVHLSEFARYENIQKNVHLAFSTLMESVPKDMPDSFVIIETTAWGLGYAKEYWDKTDPLHEAYNGFDGVFISWVADETYTVASTDLTYGDLEDLPDGTFGDEVAVHGLVTEELKLWYPDKAADPEWLAAEALRRMKWRREKIGVSGLDIFRQENPLYAEEAFLTSGNAVFDTRKLSDIRQSLEALNESGGVRYPATTYRFDLQDKRFYEARYGELKVFHQPAAGKRYVIGVDPSEGIAQGDNSAIQVLSVPDLEQVAVWKGRVAPDDLGYIAAALGEFYNWAFLCCEVNGPGFATNLVLSKTIRYPYLYRRESFDRINKTYQKRYGWRTDRGNKVVLITDLRNGVSEDLIRFRDPETLREMSYYVQDASGKTGAATGQHDDLVMALALALQMFVQGNFGEIRPIQSSTPPEGSFLWYAEQAKRIARGGESNHRSIGSLY